MDQRRAGEPSRCAVWLHCDVAMCHLADGRRRPHDGASDGDASEWPYIARPTSPYGYWRVPWRTSRDAVETETRIYNRKKLKKPRAIEKLATPAKAVAVVGVEVGTATAPGPAVRGGGGSGGGGGGGGIVPEGREN